MPENFLTLSQVEEIREQAVAAQYFVDKLADSTVLEALDSVPALCELVKVLTDALSIECGSHNVRATDSRDADVKPLCKCPRCALLRQLRVPEFMKSLPFFNEPRVTDLTDCAECGSPAGETHNYTCPIRVHWLDDTLGDAREGLALGEALRASLDRCIRFHGLLRDAMRALEPFARADRLAASTGHGDGPTVEPSQFCAAQDYARAADTKARLGTFIDGESE